MLAAVGAAVGNFIWVKGDLVKRIGMIEDHGCDCPLGEGELGQVPCVVYGPGENGPFEQLGKGVATMRTEI